MVFIQVALPLRLDWNPWYRTDAEVHVGQRVGVTFAHRPYVAVVLSIGGQPNLPLSRIMPVDSVDTGLADISPAEMKLWEFVSSYYLCTIGEVYKAAYTSSRVKSEKVAVATQRRSARSREKMRLSLQARVAGLEERLSRKEEMICGNHGEKVRSRLEAERAKILAELEAARAALERFEAEPHEDEPVFQASIDFGGKPVVLKGDGRIPYYIDETRRVLESGRSVLILEPETDFGVDIYGALKEAFGEKLLHYASGCTPVRRRQVCQLLREAAAPYVVLGMRSAVFLPFAKLGLVIVDEEQDASYKQSDSAPYYNARDVAAVLAVNHDAHLVLGSACPSLESIYNCSLGKYDLMQTVCPKTAAVEIVDIPAEKRKRGMVGDFSRKAIAAVAALPADALVTVVRCFRTEEETLSQVAAVFPGRDPQILTPAFARKATGRSALTIVMNADALFDRNDFRADEKALQMLSSIKTHTECLIVQCGAATHPVYAALCDDSSVLDAQSALLRERHDYGLPPYTRLVDIRDKSEGALFKREVLARDRSLGARKEALRTQYSSLYYLDVDPA